jgi:hypothetical protein
MATGWAHDGAAEPRLHFVEETGVQVNLLVARAIERPDRRAGGAAGGGHLAGKRSFS